jgi:LysM repeat protein
LPVLIPTLVAQIPSFIFLEATLGFFNIKTIYPSWGRIIYDGLANGALYGSPFWVLEPIFLLLLTGLAFAMLGLALERILNPRVISDAPVNSTSSGTAKSKREQRPTLASGRSKRLLVGLMLALVAIVICIPTGQGKTLASLLMNYFDPRQIVDTRITNSAASPTKLPSLTASPTSSLPTSTEPQSTSTARSSATATSTASPVVQNTLTPSPTAPFSRTYTLQRGEYPYCIARRFNVDPGELLALNGLLNRQTFYAGTELEIPQTGKPYPGERKQKAHPSIYTVSASSETLYSIACQFGDLEPLAIAQANDLPLDVLLYAGQQLTIP